jgi:hypothetical protein
MLCCRPVSRYLCPPPILSRKADDWAEGLAWSRDAYLLDTACYELYHAGTRVPLRPKVLEVLAYLVVHHDRIVSKQESLAQLWPGRVVEEDGLKTYIMAVRQQLSLRIFCRSVGAPQQDASSRGILEDKAVGLQLPVLLQ